MPRDAWHIVQTDDGPFEAKADHVVEVVGSHRHLSLNNMKGVGSIPPPFNEALHQGSIRRLLQKNVNDRLEARLPNIGLGFEDEKVVLFYHLSNASPTSIKGWWLQKKKMTLDSWFKQNWWKMMFSKQKLR